MINHFVTACFITAITVFSTGLFVYLKNRTRLLNKLYFLYTGAIFWWSVSLGAAVIAPSRMVSVLLFRLEHLAVIFIPTLFLHIVFILVGRGKKSKKVIQFTYGYSAFLAVLNFAGLLIDDAAPKFYYPHYKVAGKAYPLLMLLFAFGVCYGFYLLFRTYRRLSGNQRNRLKLFLIASTIGFTGGLPTFLPLYGINLSPFTMYMTPLFSFIFAYGIVKYRLMDVTVAINRGTAYALTFFLGILPAAVIIYFIQSVFPLAAPISLVLALAAGLALLFSRIHPFSERLVQKRLSKSSPDYYQIIKRFSQEMVTALDLRDLLSRFDQTLRQTLQVTSVAIYLTGPMNGKYPLSHASKGDDDVIPIFRNRKGELNSKTGSSTENVGLAAAHHMDIIPLWKSGDALVAMAYQAKDVLVLSEMTMMARERKSARLEETIAQMKEAKAEVCLPLKRDSKMIGIALLGHRESDKYYSAGDLELLHTLGQSACVAIQNALLVEEIKRSYQLLQRTQRLTAMGSLVAGVSHEIRNPLMPISFLVDTITESSMDEKLLSRLHEHSRESLRRIISVLDEMDELARPYTPTFKKAGLNKIVDEAITLLSAQFERSNQEVVKEFETMPESVVDGERLKQALTDILLNAAEANEQGGTIYVRTRKIHLKKTAVLPAREGVQIEITDTGCGIPSENIERVFDPFFTTKHRSLKREGTGLGLAIAHRIVEEHHGSIEVRSTVGRGTSVYVHLPVEA